MANDTTPPVGEELVEFGGDLSKIAEVGIFDFIIEFILPNLVEMASF